MVKPEDEHRQLKREAKDLANRTQLNEKQAIVLLGSRKDWTEDEIAMVLGGRLRKVERIQENLFELKLDIDEQLDELQETKEVLDDVEFL